MHNTLNYHFMIQKLRAFFYGKKGFIEVPAQSRLSILAACEQPDNIAEFKLNKVDYPLPQTGQMWLEYELLKNPNWPGVYCITTSYRDEPKIIEGRHQRIFPMFEFESHGGFNELKKLEEELIEFLGFDMLIPVSYEQICSKYETSTIEHEHEQTLAKELGNAISLERFPARTSPFWNMKYIGDGLYNKIDILLHGMETIGSAERSCDPAHMREQFYKMTDGKYSQTLFDKFGKDRVMKELDDYLSLSFFERFGAGIGVTRLERAMQLSGLLAHHELFSVEKSSTPIAWI